MKKSLIIFAIVFASVYSISCERENLNTEPVNKFSIKDSIPVVVQDTTNSIPAVQPDSINSSPAQDTVHSPDLDISDIYPAEIDLLGDEFTFTPYLADSGSFSGIRFDVQSTKRYNCLNTNLVFFNFHRDVVTKVFQMGLVSAIRPGSRHCEEGISTLSAKCSIFPIDEGVTDFEITLGKKTYSGFIARTADRYEIHWPYSNGIAFSKLLLTK